MNQQLPFATKQFPSTEQQVWEARERKKKKKKIIFSNDFF